MTSNTNTKDLDQNTNTEDLNLNSSWVFGYVGISLGLTNTPKKNQKKSWITKALCTFKTVKEFWWLMSLTVDNKHFPQNIIPNELWMFRDGCAPDWNIAKKYAKIETIADISFGNINKEQILHLCMFCVGESLPNTDDILGLRIKKQGKKLNVRLWIKTQDSANLICKAVIKELSIFGNNLVPSIKMF